MVAARAVGNAASSGVSTVARPASARPAGAAAGAAIAAAKVAAGLLRWAPGSSDTCAPVPVVVTPAAVSPQASTAEAATAATAATAPSMPWLAAGGPVPAIAQAEGTGRQAPLIPAATVTATNIRPGAAAEVPASSEHHGGSAHVEVVSELLSSTLTVGDHTPLSAAFALIRSRSRLDAPMDVDSSFPSDAAEMLSTALALKLGFLMPDDDGGDDDDDRRTMSVGVDSAFVRAMDLMTREQSEAIMARYMEVEEEESHLMDVEDEIKIDRVDVEPEAIDKMEVEGEEEARRRHAKCGCS
eukprot:g16672.t1